MYTLTLNLNDVTFAIWLSYLGDKIMAGVALANKLPITYFKNVFDDSFWVMRLLHYPRVSRNDSDNSEKGIGCGMHTDYGFLTFVNQDANRDCLQARCSYMCTWVLLCEWAICLLCARWNVWVAPLLTCPCLLAGVARQQRQQREGNRDANRDYLQ